MTDSPPPEPQDPPEDYVVPGESPNEKRAAVGGAGCGLGIYVALQVSIGFFAALYGMTGYSDGKQTMLTLFVVLALASVGVGGMLCFSQTYRTKGIGLGMIIGWALVSIGTLGVCTGLNPGLYQDM